MDTKWIDARFEEIEEDLINIQSELDELYKRLNINIYDDEETEENVGGNEDDQVSENKINKPNGKPKRIKNIE